MDLFSSIITFLQILTLIAAVSFGIFLIVSSTKSRPTTYIGLFLIAFTTDTIATLLVNFGVVVGHEYLHFLPLNFWFLSSPLLYIYTRELTRPLERHSKLLHMIPGFTEFTALLLMFILSVSGIIDIGDIRTWNSELAHYFEAAVVFTMFYYILIIWTVRKTRSSLGNEFSNVFGLELKWLEFICYMSMFTMLSWIFVSYIESYEVFNRVKFLVYIFNMFTIGLIIYSAFRQRSLGLDTELHGQMDLEVEPESSLHQTGIDTASDESVNEVGEDLAKVKALMKNEKPHLNPNLKIHDMAHLTNLSTRRLSTLIKVGTQENFRGFVNSYRIDEAKILLDSDRLMHLNMDGIAKESGFSSRTTFYTAFKRVVGCSPKEYAVSRLN